MAIDPRLAQVVNRVSAAPQKGAPVVAGKSAGGIDPRLARITGPASVATGAAPAQKPKENALTRTLNILGKPGAAVRGLVSEGGDALAGRGFEWGEVGETISKNKGWSDLMNEKGDGWKNLPGWAQGALGFAFDVGLDPLTYLGGAGVLRQGGQGAARSLMNPKVVSALAAKGFGDDVIKQGVETLVTKGAHATDKKLLAALGEVTGKSGKQGVYFAGKMIPKTEGIAAGAEKAARAVKGGFYGTNVGAKTSKLFAGKNEDIAEFIVAAKRGDIGAWHKVETSRAAARAAKQAEHVMTRTLQQHLKEFKGADVDDMRRALEGDADAVIRLGPKADKLAGVRGWFDEQAAKYNLPKIENYFPRQLSKEARKELKATMLGGKEIGPALKRELIPGREFMGEVLEGTPAQIREQVNRLMHSRIPAEDMPAFFSENTHEVLGVYIKQLSRRAAQMEAKEQLARRIGLATNASKLKGAEGMVAKAWQAGDQAAAAGVAPTMSRQGAFDLSGNVLDDAGRASVAAMGQQGVREAAGRAAMSATDVVSWRAGIKDLDNVINRLEDRLAKMAKRTGQVTDENLEARIGELYKQKSVLERRLDIVKVLNATDMEDAMLKFEQNMLDFDQALAGASGEVPKVPSDVPAAQMMFDKASLEVDPALKQIAVLEGYSEEALARLSGPERRAAVGNAAASLFPKPLSAAKMDEAAAPIKKALQNPTQLHNTVAQAARKLINGEDLDELADVLTRTSRLNTTEGQNVLLRRYDDLNNFLKRYQILSPGFHIRNAFGGEFNNWLAGVDNASRSEWRKIWIKSGFGNKPEKLSKAQREIFDWVESAGVFGNQAHDVAGEAVGRSLNPLAKNFRLTQRSRDIGGGVEGYLRGSLANHVRRKGGSIQDAFDDVAKFHFDYDDLTSFERGVMKRIIPFYTWTRKNLPLQLEQIAKQPAKYTAYMKAKDNIENMSEEEGVYPEYFDNLMSIRLPKGVSQLIPGMGDNMAYIAPDLPFRDVAEYLNPAQPTRGLEMIKSSVAVPLKLPLEMQAGKKFFNDQPFYEGWEKAPGTWKLIPGLLPALATIGIGDKGKDGEYYMDQRDAYKVEQLMPLLARVRRMAPMGEGDAFLAERQMTSILSTNLGVGIRANTPASQQAELRRRGKANAAAARKQRDLGYIE